MANPRQGYSFGNLMYVSTTGALGLACVLLAVLSVLYRDADPWTLLALAVASIVSAVHCYLYTLRLRGEATPGQLKYLEQLEKAEREQHRFGND